MGSTGLPSSLQGVQDANPDQGCRKACEYQGRPRSPEYVCLVSGMLAGRPHLSELQKDSDGGAEDGAFTLERHCSSQGAQTYDAPKPSAGRTPYYAWPLLLLSVSPRRGQHLLWQCKAYVKSAYIG